MSISNRNLYKFQNIMYLGRRQLSKSREMTSNVWAMRRRESYVLPLGRFN